MIAVIKSANGTETYLTLDQFAAKLAADVKKWTPDERALVRMRLLRGIRPEYRGPQ